MTSAITISATMQAPNKVLNSIGMWELLAAVKGHLKNDESLRREFLVAPFETVKAIIYDRIGTTSAYVEAIDDLAGEGRERTVEIIADWLADRRAPVAESPWSLLNREALVAETEGCGCGCGCGSGS